MSSYELLELFGVDVIDPETRTVWACVYSPDAGMRILQQIAVEVDENPVRTIQVDFAPEDGVLASALRDGERPEWKQMLAQSANESAVLRAAQVQGADGDEYGSRLFLPVWRERELIAEDVIVQTERARPAEPGGMESMWQLREEVS